MSLTSQLDRYLSVRRSLGYDLATSERILRRFTRFADSQGAVHIDTALFLRWHATLAEGCSSTRAARLVVVRLFALWLSSFDPKHEAPPRGLLPGLQPVAPAYLHRRRNRVDHRSSQGAAIDLWPARADLLDVVRADRGHRPEDQRGAGAQS
jgi:hypothetical protein